MESRLAIGILLGTACIMVLIVLAWCLHRASEALDRAEERPFRSASGPTDGYLEFLRRVRSHIEAGQQKDPRGKYRVH